jgi:hypothetical protein
MRGLRNFLALGICCEADIVAILATAGAVSISGSLSEPRIGIFKIPSVQGTRYYFIYRFIHNVFTALFNLRNKSGLIFSSMFTNSEFSFRKQNMQNEINSNLLVKTI